MQNKKFIVTLVCILLIIVGVVIFINKRNAKQADENLAAAFTFGAILTEQDCATSYWGAERYKVIADDPSQMTSAEEEQLFTCVNQ